MPGRSVSLQPGRRSPGSAQVPTPAAPMGAGLHRLRALGCGAPEPRARAMDLNFSDELVLLRDLARDFTDQELRPRAEAIEREHRVPRELLDKLAEVGLM